MTDNRQFAVSRAAEVVARSSLTIQDARFADLGKAIGVVVVAAAREIETYLNESVSDD